MKRIRKTAHSKKSGYALLATVTIVSALIFAISIGITTRARNTMWAGFSVVYGKQAQVLVNACTEYALYQFAQTLHYDGNEGIIIENGTCTILPVTDIDNGKKEIRTEMTIGGYTKRAVVEVDEREGVLKIVDWHYVSEH